MSNMGQRNTNNGGLHVFFTDTEGDKSIFQNSSIHDCNGPCIVIDHSWNVDFVNNVMYKGLGKIMAVNDVKTWKIKNNAFIGALRNY